MKFIKATIIILALAGIAAAAVESMGRYDQVTRGESRSLATTDSADPAADTAYAASPTIAFRGRQTITLSARTSVSGATVKLGLWRGTLFDGTFKPASYAEATVAANASYTIGGRYACPSVAFDTAGYDVGYVLVESITSGDAKVEVSVH